MTSFVVCTYADKFDLECPLVGKHCHRHCSAHTFRKKIAKLKNHMHSLLPFKSPITHEQSDDCPNWCDAMAAGTLAAVITMILRHLKPTLTDNVALVAGRLANHSFAVGDVYPRSRIHSSLPDPQQTSRHGSVWESFSVDDWCIMVHNQIFHQNPDFRLNGPWLAGRSFCVGCSIFCVTLTVHCFYCWALSHPAALLDRLIDGESCLFENGKVL